MVCGTLPIIQASGGNFDYTIEVTNNEETPGTFDVWTNVTLPDGEPYPVDGPFEVRLQAGWSASNDTSQYVPADASAGDYIFFAKVGTSPDEVWASDYFTFEKLAAGGGWYTQNAETSDLLLSVYFTDSNTGWAVGNLGTILHTVTGGE